MNVDYKLIGSRIKSCRRRKNFTQEQLAENLGVSVGYVSQAERGATKINIEFLSSVADILQCDTAFLITGSSQGSANYMADEISSRYSRLGPNEKRLVIGFMDLLLENRLSD